MTKENKWWQNSVVYQIYPRSFQDSNGDGVGDIQGIIKRLDYLEDLGIDAIWLSPVYRTPNDDNGYDISDYQEIEPEFGTMEDMDQLIKKAKEHGIQIVMDLVVNHTSDEHAWFIEAKANKDSKYRDYYIWRDPVNGDVPNNLKSTFSGSAWELDKESGQYYLHLFSKKQPDLNWENEEMRKEIYSMMNFWLEKGIGGFRMDVIDLIGKVPDQQITGNGPKLHDYLQEMNRESFGNYDVMTVGETWGATPENASLYADSSRDELSMIFQFEHILLDEQAGKSKWDLKVLELIDLKRIFNKWQNEIPHTTWNSLFWNNHDTPRIVSRWGNDAKYRVESSKMLAILLHLMKGTPYIYQGEEIGMTNRPITEISEANDIETINMYHERLAEGFDREAVMDSINTKGRDNARTPMQWNNETNAGFTTGTPWLDVNDNFVDINVENALKDKESIFYMYKKLIELRKQNPIIVHGNFKLLLPNDETIFAFERQYEGEIWTVVANFSEEPVHLQLKEQGEILYPILSNYKKETYDLSNLGLEPFETFVVKNNV